MAVIGDTPATLDVVPFTVDVCEFCERGLLDGRLDPGPMVAVVPVGA